MYEPPKKTEQKDQKVEDYPQTDWLLANFVLNANVFGMTVGVTLSVGGNVVTGILISSKEYFQKLGQQLSEGTTDPEVKKSTQKLYDDLALLADEQIKKGYEENADKALDQVGFIHLNQARVVTGGNLLPTAGHFLWRGRLTQIDGFSLGFISKKSDED